ncbi:hypothetical protein [Streptosporangium carneum]|uniref:Uncharacterized protein n=1 Tax=Streptosporangium carneum TaxID=47481 RepID=A0A9W6MGD8_9ACTN|nr:hypothetical protein [Streptosporangium carneum]GLK13136.1 hypothetical protein GCM10017600_65470 [Streptosporangium carneum]
MSTSSTTPRLSAPVERSVTGAPASDAAGVTPSFMILGSTFSGLPFAGEGDE